MKVKFKASGLRHLEATGSTTKDIASSGDIVLKFFNVPPAFVVPNNPATFNLMSFLKWYSNCFN